MKQIKPTPFSLIGSNNILPDNLLGKMLESVLGRVLSLSQLEQMYQQLPASTSLEHFIDLACDKLNIKIQASDEELARIPETGPLQVVANHPFGALEGLLLASLLKKKRPDVKVMANRVLTRIPELASLFISVNPFASEGAAQSNMAPLKNALNWLKQGGVLIVFPAGEVSHLDLSKRQVVDPIWSKTIGRLVELAQVPVQSYYFHGSNSKFFQLAGMLHPLLRTTLLPRELLNKQDMVLPVHISHVIPFKKLNKLGGARDITNYLRLRTYMLRHTNRDNLLPNLEQKKNKRRNEEIVTPAHIDNLIADIQHLDKQCLLLDNGEMQVYCAKAAQIPNVMYEIGRLREETFRAAGEGTGREIDIDFYDNYYLHLFIWNSVKNEVVGAYRLGQSDEIIAKYGISGLYSHSLFQFNWRFLYQIYPALELGRSFIRTEYQRSFAPLLLLWKGIGQFVVRNPRYRMLFGPVSISQSYQALSQKLIAEYMLNKHSDADLAALVRARKPFKLKQQVADNSNGLQLNNLESLTELISELELDHKGIPILLKQYLKMSGKLLGFNVDKKFNCLDGLIMVDLCHTDESQLVKYMGVDGMALFLASHQEQTATQHIMSSLVI